MPINDDQTARKMTGGPEHEALAGDYVAHGDNNLASEMQAILKLIGTQIEQSDQRHSEALTGMYERLHALSHEAQLTQAKASANLAPAIDRIREGIDQLAGLVAKADPAANESAEPSEEPDTRADNAPADTTDASDTSFIPTSEFSQPEPAEQFAGAADPDMSSEDMIITDNAADRMQFENDGIEEHASAVEGEAPDQQVLVFEAQTAEALPDDTPPLSNTQRDASPNVVESINGNPDQPWDLESAEALTRVYESELGSVAQAPTAQPAGLKMDTVANAPRAETQPQAQHDSGSIGFQSAAPAASFDESEFRQAASNSCAGSCISNVAPAIEQAWLEDRFSEIAAKIEETFAELRNDTALNDLSDRFGDFEVRMGHALEEVATRQDLDALKSAEDQIDSMVGYFERVEDRLGRIDSLEAQMEALLDRVSDDRLLQLFQSQGASAGADLDYSAIAEAAAESAAQRLLPEFAGASASADNETAIVEMREALEAFIAERRDHDNEAAGMLDTIQQALVRVLDRVEVLEDDQPADEQVAVPMSDPRIEPDAEFAEEPVAELAQGEYEFDAPEPDSAYAEERRSDNVEEQYPETSFEPEPIASEPPQQDYSQRLQFPAAIEDGQGNGGIPETRATELDVDGPVAAGAAYTPELSDPQRFSEEPVDEISTPQPDYRAEMPEAPAQPQVQPRSATQMAAPHAGPQANAQATAPPPHSEAASGPLSKGDAIERLRREFIEDAKRARERAAQQAVAEQAEAERKPSLASKISVPGLSGLSMKIPGVAKAGAPVEQPIAPQGAPIRRAVTAAAPQMTTPGEEEKAPRSALPRSKILVGAVIVLFATAGALLMMRGKPQTVDTAPPPAIEQTYKPSGEGPELVGPEIEESGVPSGSPQGSYEEGRVYDGEQNYRVSGDVGSDIPAGVAITGLEKGVNPDALAKAQSQRALAKLSSDLGAAAAYATPTNLIENELGTTANNDPASSVASTAKGNQLDLPPATVGPLSLRIAAAKGDPSAQFEVAARLAGGTGTKQDLAGAIRWYKMSAAQGFAQAQYRLGTLYERGMGIEKDLSRASLWYNRAASAGNVKAMHNLAVVSAGGNNGNPDYKMAAKWFGQAAQYGLGDSQFNMAVLYENGLGVAKDMSEAYVHYALAAAKGDQQAVKQRDTIRVKLSPAALTKADKKIKTFRPKRSDRLVNDARVAGEDWKKRADYNY